MLDGRTLVAECRKWLGVPYLHGGRNREGVDCAGLLLVVAHDLGLTDLDWKDYSVQVNSAWLQSNMLLLLDPVEGRPEAGDILLMAISAQPHHLAMATGDGYIIHSLNGQGVCEHNYSPRWRRHLRGTFRWKGLTNG